MSDIEVLNVVDIVCWRNMGGRMGRDMWERARLQRAVANKIQFLAISPHCVPEPMQGEHGHDHDHDCDSRTPASAFLATVALFFLIRSRWCSPVKLQQAEQGRRGAEDTWTALLKARSLRA